MGKAMPHMPTQSSGKAWREACAAISGRVSAFMSRSIVGNKKTCYIITIESTMIFLLQPFFSHVEQGRSPICGICHAQTSATQPAAGQPSVHLSIWGVRHTNSQCAPVALRRQTAAGVRSQRPGSVQDLFPDLAGSLDHRL